MNNRFGVLGEPLAEHLDPPEEEEEDDDPCFDCLYQGQCEGCSGLEESKEEDVDDEFIG